MATRIICDQCGNIMPSVAKRYWIMVPPVTSTQFVQSPYAGGLLGAGPLGGGGQSAQAVQTVHSPVFEVELCVRCDEVWFARVKKLTQHTVEEVKEG